MGTAQQIGIVLVVEDEPLVRMSAVAVLEDAGYAVLEAADGDEALSILESNPQIRVIFTDIEMPGSLNGLQLAQDVRHRWPPMEIIVTSGRFVGDDVELPERGCFLRKPYRALELTDQLQRFRA